MEKRNRQCSCGLPRILPWFQSPLIGWRHESEKIFTKQDYNKNIISFKSRRKKVKMFPYGLIEPLRRGCERFSSGRKAKVPLPDRIIR